MNERVTSKEKTPMQELREIVENQAAGRQFLPVDMSLLRRVVSAPEPGQVLCPSCGRVRFCDPKECGLWHGAAQPPRLNHDESVMLLQDAEDAKRYRFLRDQRRWYANTPPAPGINIKFEYLIGDNGEALDAAIDKELERATATKEV